jgi:hypothetical protein
MKKINFKGISRVLSDLELKNVTGGSGGDGCESGEFGLCLGNCIKTSGAAGKCLPNSNNKCSCVGG